MVRVALANNVLAMALLCCGKVIPSSNDANGAPVFCDDAAPSGACVNPECRSQFLEYCEGPAPGILEPPRCYIAASWPQCHWTPDGGVALDGGTPACPDGYQCVAVSMTFDWDAGATDDVACDLWDGAAVPGYHSLCWPTP